MYNYQYHDYVRDLQYQNKVLKKKVADLESGEKHVQMEAKHKSEMSYSNRENKKLRREIADLNSRIVTNRNNWITTLEESEAEHTKEIEKKDREIQLAKNQSKRFLLRIQKERDKKREALKELYAVRTKLDEVIDRANKLDARLKKDSTNSDKSPSSDTFTKAKAETNREKSENSIGGQPGHKGHYLKPVKNPDVVLQKKPQKQCPHCNGKVAISDEYEVRQLIDLEIKVVTTEERCYEGVCSDCGCVLSGEFTEGFNSPIGYGSTTRTIISTLSADSNVTVNKIVKFISSLTDNRINMSHGTVINVLNELAEKLEPTVTDISDMLINCDVLHADETGLKINGNTTWMQILANKDFTLFGRSPSRGKPNKEMNEILTLFVGTLMHDHLMSYYSYKHLTHAECNTHADRYLKAVNEIMKHPWAQEMKVLLHDAYRRKEELIAQKKTKMSKKLLDEFRERYISILDRGVLEYEDAIVGKENIKYYDEERRLLTRLREYIDEHLRFITDFKVPFSNNVAELGARFIKGKKKVSGTFRSPRGMDSYATIASVIDTLRKQKRGIFSSINSTFKGKTLRFLPDSHISLEQSSKPILDSS